ISDYTFTHLTPACPGSLPVSFDLLFLSTRRRHTISYRNWSSDVCSSDLRRLARRVRAALREIVYGTALPRAQLKEIAEVRTRMEVELGKETRGRWHVKYGRGGLVDVEFLTQALQLVHGRHHVEARTPAPVQALRGLARAGAPTPATAAQLA